MSDDRPRREDGARDERGAPDGVELPGGGVYLGSTGETGSGNREARFEDLASPFVLMGLAALGIVPHPESGRSEIDLPAARVAIECLELLRRKTHGNRTDRETAFLEQALYELKLQYAERRDRAGRRDEE